MMGRTENNRMVNFNGNEELIGRFVEVRITEARTNSLQAEYVGLSALERSNMKNVKLDSATIEKTKKQSTIPGEANGGVNSQGVSGHDIDKVPGQLASISIV